MFIQRLQITAVPRKEPIIISPYLGKMTKYVKTRLTKTMNEHMKNCKLRVLFQIYTILKNYFHFKDSVPETLRSSLVYKFLCGSCTAPALFQNIRVFPKNR